MIRRYKSKTSLSSNSLLQKTLRRTHADALRKRFPIRPISPPNPYAIPYLDEDIDDEFDDDEDDEIIDDFEADDADIDVDVDGDAQVDDIVDMYNQRNPDDGHGYGSSEKYSYIRTGHGGSEEHGDGVGEPMICLSSKFMTDHSGLDSVTTLKPVPADTGAYVYVADNSDF